MSLFLVQIKTAEKNKHIKSRAETSYDASRFVLLGNFKVSIRKICLFNSDTAAPVAEWLRSLTSVLLIIRSSHRCGFAPRTGHEFICETSHVLLAGVSGGFSPDTPVFAPPTD